MMNSVISLAKESARKVDPKIGAESYAKKDDAGKAVDDLFDF